MTVHTLRSFGASGVARATSVALSVRLRRHLHG